MSNVEEVIAGTAFEIVARNFASSASSEHKSFRLKNLTRPEAIAFLRVWKTRGAGRSLDRVRVVVASDAHDDFPAEFRADPGNSITYYRNHNDRGLVYIETKVESDEQGLKNLFTLRDVNFLDGTFDQAGSFTVAEEMFRQAMQCSGAEHFDGNKLLRDRLVEVLTGLKSASVIVPVRKFAEFVLSAAEEVISSQTNYSSDETDALVGRCLIHLDMFPDEQWRQSSTRVARRLSLNLLRSELAASPSADLDIEKTVQDCIRTKFVDLQGTTYSHNDQKYWREECSEYCRSPSSKRREGIPYRIFDQVFSKDIKGLPLGERVAEEISDKDPARKEEFDRLEVETGLNGRSADEARKLLESVPAESDLLPLKDLLSKQTLRMIQKLASPAVERIQNPLIKLSEVAQSFRERNTLAEGNFRIELRAGDGTSDQHRSTVGLFSFLYGQSLIEVQESLSNDIGTIHFAVDKQLTTQITVPPLKEELDPELEVKHSSTTEEDEGVTWPPIPLEFVLVNTDNNTEVDSESSIEWLPEDLPYFVLFWISVCGEDRGELAAELHAPNNMSGEAWLGDVAYRIMALDGGGFRPLDAAVVGHPIISELLKIRSTFRSDAEANGLSVELLNDIFDQWSTLLAEARATFVPNGDVPLGMIEFMNSDCILDFDNDRVLMLQSHPLKLRWIAAYLTRSIQLAVGAIEGSLNLNSQNERLYLDWIEGLSPHQQPSIHAAVGGHILFADGERGWTENFQKEVSSGGASSGDRLHSSLVVEIVRQITAYLHAHPYKADGLKILIVSGGATALPADIVQSTRKSEFKSLAMTIECVMPKSCWSDAARKFELVDTENRLSGDGALFPPVQLNFHDLEKVKEDADKELGDLVCDIAIVPQFLDDNVNTDAKTESESSSIGRFDALLDEPTYIASGAGSSALWVSLRPRMSDKALSDWSTLAVRYERRNPVAADRPEAADFIDIRINFHSTARFFGALHKRSHWVITVERHITREQIERLETRPEVLSLRDGVGPGGLFTIIVSSNAGKQFVIDRLTRKLRRISSQIGRSELVETQAQHLAQLIYEEARQISPRLTLDALGISRVTEEILGLSIARRIADVSFPVNVNDGFSAWISLDEHPEWFMSANSMRADMVRLTVDVGSDGLSVDLLVLESKLRRSGFEAHGAEQVYKTLQMFDAVFPQDPQHDSLDGELWRDLLLGAVDTVSEDAVVIPQKTKSGHSSARSRVSEEIRSLFRKGRFASVRLSGLYSICEYSHPREIEVDAFDADPRIQIVQTGGSALLDRIGKSPGATSDSATNNATAQDNAKNGSHEGSESEEAAMSRSNNSTDQQSPVVDNAADAKSTEIQIAAEKNYSQKSVTRGHLGKTELDQRYQIILDTFGQYGVSVNRTENDTEYAIEGPASILFRVMPGKGVDPKKLTEKSDALKLALKLTASQEIRFDIDQGYMTIDVPKLDKDRYFVDAAELWSRWKRPESGLSVPLGEDRFGKIVEIDFTSSNSPHLLIGGTTGSGKSEALNTILGGLIKHYSPQEVRLQLIDPKGTELQHLSNSEHVLGEIGWLEEDAIQILSEAVDQMQERYSKFKAAAVKTLRDYNTKVVSEEKLPRLVIVLDEYADLTSEPDAKKVIEGHLKRLAQKARAAGIHVIIATQKPDATVISTNLRSNLPAQLALRVKSATESRVIMDDPGAETLTGKGDAFLKESGTLTRVQCAKI